MLDPRVGNLTRSPCSANVRFYLKFENLGLVEKRKSGWGDNAQVTRQNGAHRITDWLHPLVIVTTCLGRRGNHLPLPKFRHPNMRPLRSRVQVLPPRRCLACLNAWTQVANQNKVPFHVAIPRLSF